MIFVDNINILNKVITALLLGLLVTILPFYRASAMVSNEPAAPGKLVIYQVQTGISSSATQELITIYNNGDQPIDVTGWGLMYSSSTGNTNTDLGVFVSTQPDTHVILGAYSSMLAGSNEFHAAHPDVQLSMIFDSGLSGTAGHVRLIDPDRQDKDVLGYGAAVYPETTAKTAAPTNKILQRIAQGQKLQDTDNNSADFFSTDLVIPNSGVYEQYIEPPVKETMQLLITEVLPNPAGTDTGHEYIEFYNPNSTVISLKDYVILIGPAFTKSYPLPDITVEPNSYHILTDAESGITLPNTSASLLLRNADGIDLMTMPAYNQLPDDVVWAYDGEIWLASYAQTPGAANEFIDSKPCGTGYTRSVETGTCQKLTPATIKSSTACPVGQIRNTETNRCRKVVSAVESTLCEAGKIKNPATGRCKKIEELATQKVCPAGQERNNETNRCRKIVTKSSSIPQVKDVSTPVVENNAKWWAAGIAGSGSVSYAAYEWRQEVLRRFGSLKSILGNLFSK